MTAQIRYSRAALPATDSADCFGCDAGGCSGPLSGQSKNGVVVFHHPRVTRQRIDDRVDAVLEQPLDSLGVLLGRADQAELVEQRVRNQVGGAIEIALFPRCLDLPRIVTQT